MRQALRLVAAVAAVCWAETDWAERLSERIARGWGQPEPPGVLVGPGPSSGLVGLAEVEQLLAVQRWAERRPELQDPTTGRSQANCELFNQGMRDRMDDYNRSVHAGYLAGGTLVCHLVPALWPPLAGLMAGLAERLGLPFMANLYLSPHQSRGFTPHTDAKPGLILQLAGRKRWQLRRTRWQEPTRTQLVGRPWQQPAESVALDELYSGTLETGSALYVPRGAVHNASSLDQTASLHLTVSPVKNCEWHQLLLGLLRGTTWRSREMAQFAQHAVAMAVKEMTGTAEQFWIRGPLPLNYSRPSHRAELDAAAASALVRLEGLLEVPAPRLRAEPGAGCGE